MTRTRKPLASTDGLTIPNASPIETHVNCLNSAGRFNHFSPYYIFSVTYQDKAWDVLVRKQARYGYAYQTDFELRPLECKKVNTVKIGL